MKVAVISDSEGLGGAALSARRLFDGLGPAVNARWFVARRERGGPQTVEFTQPGLVRRVIGDVAGWVGQEDSRLEQGLAASRNTANLVRLVGEFGPDAISLHSINQWTRTGLRRSVVAGLCAAAPVVWTLHDLWPLTGYADYPDEFVQAGGEGTERAQEQAFEAVFHSDRVSGDETDALIGCGDRLVLVATSRWMQNLASKVFSGKLGVELIPHGVNLNLFRPSERPAARVMLDVPGDRPVVMAIATHLHARRKGMGHLLAALKELGRDVTLLLVGSRRSPFDVPSNCRLVELGDVPDPRLLRLAYSCADVMVAPSLCEVFGLVLIEALACGTPCVAFNTGGMPDIVRPGVTGELAASGNAAELARAISRVLALDAVAARSLSGRCRDVAEKDYDVRVQANRYRTLFETVADD